MSAPVGAAAAAASVAAPAVTESELDKKVKAVAKLSDAERYVKCTWNGDYWLKDRVTAGLSAQEQDARLFDSDEIAEEKLKQASYRANQKADAPGRYSASFDFIEDFCATISLSGDCGGFEFAVAQMFGTSHRIMEDRYAVSAATITIGGKDHELAFFSVIDGHGGIGTAEVVKEFLFEDIKGVLPKHWTEGDSPKPRALYNAIIEGCCATQARIVTDKSSGGAVMTAFLIIDKKTAIPFNVGDCRSIYCNDSTWPDQLTEDSSAANPSHQAGVIRRGGTIDTRGKIPRVSGDLAMTRSFGDLTCRGVSCRPVVYVPLDISAFGPSDYLINMSDGMTDVLGTDQVDDELKEFEHLSIRDIANGMALSAQVAGSRDDITFMIVRKPVTDLK